jgi:hypothetical protein
MAALTKTHKLCVLLGILFFLLVNFPLAQIFNLDILWMGVPVLTWYVFTVWLLALVGLFFFGHRLNRTE